MTTPFSIERALAPFAWLRLLLRSILLFLSFVLGIVRPAHAVDHSPRWLGNTLTYGLTDLDNFPVRSYGYCKWGVLQDELNQNTATLDFTARTAGPFANSTKELFLSHSTVYLDRLGFPADAAWDPANGAYMDGSVTFTQYSGAPPVGANLNVALFRHLHFPSIVFTTESDGREPRLTASAKKLIVLIHGWNPNGNPDSYTDEFAALDTRLRSQINGTDWKLLKYHWEADADTGGKFSFSAAVHGARAAEGGHQHGQHLGELLDETCPNLERVHFIAHSAGSWAARAAAKYLLAHNPNVVVEVTLLDPFIPGAVPVDSSLTTDKISGILQFQGSERILQLENYYAIDIALGTQEQFAWSQYDINRVVDYSSNIPGVQTYGGHFGPIQFYADTVTSTVLGETVPSDLADAPYYPANSTQLGWWRSLFFNEIIIDQQPVSVTNATQGQPVSFTTHATTRREQKGFSFPGHTISYAWQKYDPATATWSTAYGSSALPTYTLSSPIPAYAGQYRVIAYSGQNQTISEVFTLDFDTGTGSPFVTLQSPAPGATVSGSIAVNAEVTANITRVQFFVDGALKANDTAAPFAFIWNTLQAADGPHTLTAQAYGGLIETLLGISAPVTVTVHNDTTGTPTNDPYEPNNSSLTATPLGAGQSRVAYVDSPSDVDWYSIPITTPGALAISLLVPAGRDYDLELYGPDAAWIAGSYAGAGLAESITYNAAVTGTYFVRVYGWPAGHGSYDPATPYSIAAGFASGPITITTPPQSRTVPAGASASFSVAASGAPVLAYQWQKNGVDLPGATSPTYATPVLSLADSGPQYRVRVSNAFGSVLSAPATLTVFTASAVTWTGSAGDGNWFNPANWSPTTVPTNNHIAQINSGTVNVPTNAAFAVLNLSGGSVTGTFTVTRTMNWTGGTLSGQLTVATGGVLNLGGNSDKVFDRSSSLTNAGTVNWSGTGNIYGYNSSNYGTATIINQASGVFDIQTDADFAYANYYRVNFSITNAGVFRKSAGSGITSLGWADSLANTGVVQVQSGTFSTSTGFTNSGVFDVGTGASLALTGGAVTLNSGSLFTGAGAVNLSGGTLTGTLTGSNFVFGSGTLYGTPTLAGTMNWTGGTLSGQLTVAAGGVLNLGGNSDKVFDRNSSLTNAGTVKWTGTGNIYGYNSSNYGTATISNQASGVFDIQTDADFTYANYYRVAFVVTNAGLLRKSAGTGTTSLGWADSLANTGVVQVQSGTFSTSTGFTNSGVFDVGTGASLALTGGAVTLNSDSLFTGAGAVNLSGGTLTGTLTGSNFVFGSGTLYGTPTLAGTMNWTGGTLSGQLTVAAGGVLNLGGNSDKVFDRNSSLTNAGTVKWTGTGNIYGYNSSNYGTATISNQASGVFDIQTDADFTYANYYRVAFVVTNAGLLRKSAGTGTTSLGWADSLANTGVVQVQSGTFSTSTGFTNSGVFDVGTGASLALTGGAVTLNSDSLFTGAGAVNLSGGTLTGTLTGSNFVFGSGTLYGTPTLAGTMNWTGGTLSGQLTVAAGGVLNLGGNSDKVFDRNSSLTNAGTVKWTGTGNIYGYNSSNYGTATISNQASGVFDIQTDADFAYANYYRVTFAVTNAGVFRKSAGSGITSLGWADSLANTGVVQVQSGDLSFPNGFTQSAGSTNLSGGTISGSALNISGGGFSGSGTISGSVTNSGQCSPGASPGTLTIAGNYTQLPGAVLDIELGGLTAGSQYDRLIVTGTATLNGTLRVTRVNGFQPAAGQSFQVMTFASRSGNFAQLSGSTIDANLALTGTATATSYTLTAGTPPFQQWQTAQFGANAGNPLIAGPGADPDGDSIVNWLEYSLGLNPNQRDVTKLPTAAVQKQGSNAYLTLKYPQRIGQPALDYNVGVSDALQAWDWTESQIEQLGLPVATGDGLTEEVTVRLATPMNGVSRKFLRLRVNQLP